MSKHDDLTSLTDKEIMRRLDSFAMEYDRTVKEAIAKLTKVDNLRREIEPLVAELNRRSEGGDTANG